MKTTTERLEPTKVKLTVEVPYDELKPAMEKAYKDVASKVNIPGFRRGHAPRQIIDRHVGRGYVIEQAVNDDLQRLYVKALEESGVTPFARPDVEVTKTPHVEGAPGGELIFTAQMTCHPEFDLPSLDDAELTITCEPVSVDDVEAELESLRDRFSSLKTVERPVKEGDYTSIDMVARIDGKEVDSVAGVSYQQGAKTMLSGLDDALLGMSAGDTKTFDTEFVGGEHAGEKGEATVTLSQVKEKELPEPDDDFAMMASEFDTIGELRTDLRKKLEKSREEKRGVDAIEQLQNYINDHVDVEVPEDIVKERMDNPYYENMEEDSKKEAESGIREALKADIIRQKIIRESDAHLEEGELLEALMRLSQMYGIQPQQIAQDPQQLAAMSAQLTENKALALMLRDVVVKDQEGNIVDLTQFIDGAMPKKNDNETDDSASETADDQEKDEK